MTARFDEPGAHVMLAVPEEDDALGSGVSDMLFGQCGIFVAVATNAKQVRRDTERRRVCDESEDDGR